MEGRHRHPIPHGQTAAHRATRLAVAGLTAMGFMLLAGEGRAQIAAPSCDAMGAWAAKFDAKDEWQPSAIANRHRFAKLFAAPETAALFGKPMPSWTEADVASVREAVLACRRATKDRELSGLYNSVQSQLSSRLGNFARDAATARVKAAAAMETLKQQPPSLQTLRLFAALAETATPDGYAQTQRAAGGLPGQAATAGRDLVAALRDLPEADIAETVATPSAALAQEMRAGVVAKLIADLDGVPADANGLRVLGDMRQAVQRDYGDALGPDETKKVQQAVEDRRAAVGQEIAAALETEIGQSSQGFDAFADIDRRTPEPLLAQLPATLAARVRETAQARRQTVADTLFKETQGNLAGLPETDGSLNLLDQQLQALAGWPPSATGFKPRFEEAFRERRAKILAAVNKAEAGSIRGRIYESEDKARKLEFVDRTRVFATQFGSTVAGTYTEESDGRVVVTVGGNALVMSREGRRLAGWDVPLVRSK